MENDVAPGIRCWADPPPARQTRNDAVEALKGLCWFKYSGLLAVLQSCVEGQRDEW